MTGKKEKCTGGIVVGYDFRLRHSDKKTPDSQAKIDCLRSLIAELAKGCYPMWTENIGDENAPYCVYCHKGKKFGHADYCPISRVVEVMG